MDTSLIVALVGVGGTLLASAIGFAGNAILENIRLNNERKTHMMKALFDKECEFYQVINEKMILLFLACKLLCSTVHTNIEKKRLSKEDTDNYCKTGAQLLEAYQNAEIKLKECAPFIQKNIYSAYEKYLETTKKILTHFGDFMNYFKIVNKADEDVVNNVNANKVEILYSANKNLDECSKLLHKAMEEIKHYINSLEDNKNGRKT